MSVSCGYFAKDVAAVISDSSIEPYRILEGDTTDTTRREMVLKAASDASVPPLAVSLDSTSAADRAITVRVDGVVKIECDGSGTAIDIGDPIVATTGGKGIKADTGGTSAQWCIGTALEPCVIDGGIILVDIGRAYYPVAT